ncbi:MAG: TIGR01777 family oxidoreductase [Thermoanaerobaculia bacterium]
MLVAISGGSGLIGRALARKLLEQGRRVVVLSRRPEGVRNLPSGAQVEGWDTRSVEELVPILDAADAFVHLAGENIGAGRWTSERKRRIRSSRVDSTLALARAFESTASPPKVLVQGSAVGFYGARGPEPLAETASAGDGFLAAVCSQWEEAGATVSALGVRRVIARTGVVFASRDGALPRILLPFKLLAGGPVGSGDQVLSWIHLDDQVGAMAHLLDDEGAEGAFNLTAPGAVTNRELARVIGRVLRRPAFFPTPGFALRVLLGEMSTLVLDGQRAIPARLLERSYDFRFSEVEAALRDLTA